MRNRPRNVEAYAPIPARHVAAVLGREPAGGGGLNEIRHHGQSVGRPVVASLRDVHAPAASLGRRQAPPIGDGRPATVSPRAQIKKVRAAIPSLPRPCPVTPPKAVRRRGASHRCRVLARKAIRSGPKARPCGPPRRPRDCAPPPRSCRSPPPAGPHLARPSAVGGAPPLCVGIRSGREVVVATLRRQRCAAPRATAAPRLPPCAGPGSCPGPCRDPGRLRRPRRDNPPDLPPCCRCSIIEPALDKCKTIPTSNNLRNFLVM